MSTNETDLLLLVCLCQVIKSLSFLSRIALPVEELLFTCCFLALLPASEMERNTQNRKPESRQIPVKAKLCKCHLCIRNESPK